MHQGQGGHTEADSYATDGAHDAPWVSAGAPGLSPGTDPLVDVDEVLGDDAE